VWRRRPVWGGVAPHDSDRGWGPASIDIGDGA
jgi:hypothetical protein